MISFKIRNLCLIYTAFLEHIFHGSGIQPDNETSGMSFDYTLSNSDLLQDE